MTRKKYSRHAPVISDKSGTKQNKEFSKQCAYKHMLTDDADYIIFKGRKFHKALKIHTDTIKNGNSDVDFEKLTVSFNVKSEFNTSRNTYTDAIIDINTKRHNGWYRLYAGEHSTYKVEKLDATL